ncbi:MAG TPA: MBL fold metallo-hydrolase [Phycisphaerae bacterium]|nr:MBL fold metallo-hydrolase [Phycisphaerae bacterium]
MQIHFHGACRTVTGSQHEIRTGPGEGGKRILLDVGAFQGPRALARKINTSFDFDPRTVDAVVLSHGHTDHCGNLPNLVRQGYRGPIYCTAATAAVTALMLMDAAKIQEEDAAYLNQKTNKTWQGEIVPLFTREDARQTIEQFVPIPYQQAHEFHEAPGVTVELRDAGHVVGSAAVRLTNLRTGKCLVFTGDVGRPNAPLVQNPDPFHEADAVISECTYGGKTHAAIDTIPAILAGIVNDTAQRGGILMIPAFALGRTQAMVEILHELRNSNQIPHALPIFVDSPLALRLTDVHRRFLPLLDEQTRQLLEPFDFPSLTYVTTPQESRELNDRRGTFVVIAGSGMCESGRILHHLKHHIHDPRSTLLLPGYQAADTLGRRLQDGQRRVPILGDLIPVRARIETLHGLSAHADEHELTAYSQPLKSAQFYLVHGEVAQAQAHAASLQQAGFPPPIIATRGDVADI